MVNISFYFKRTDSQGKVTVLALSSKLQSNELPDYDKLFEMSKEIDCKFLNFLFDDPTSVFVPIHKRDYDRLSASMETESATL